jgi:CubicO group peptidase (beta-lactamase class C family)
MKSLLAPVAFLSLYLLGNLSPAAQKALQPPETFDLKAIDTYLTDYLRAKNLPGLSVAVVRNGELVFAKGYGKRSLEDDRPVETDTLFAIGSITKQFTCALVLMLAEEGKLSVHDKVSKYFPELTRANDIALLDLMNNVSGYADYYPLDFVDRRMRQHISPDDLLRRYAGDKLDFEPGSRYSYSNTGFILLGRVVEKVSGEPFGEFLSRRILKPLGMDHTSYEPDATDKRLARGYTTFALSDPEYSAPEAKGWIGAAGGIYSTPSDLAKWDMALIGGKVLKPESYELMTQPRKLNDGKFTEYGCGLGVRMQGGRQILAHNGAVSGFVAYNATVPSTRSALIVMCNQDGGYGAVPGQIFSLLLKEPVPSVPKIAGLAAADMAKKMFTSYQKGRVHRDDLSEEFNLYLTDARITGAAKRLKGYGAVRKVEVLTSNERGGMEVSTARLTFRKSALKTLMYRLPDGKIEQFFVYPE